MLIDLLIKDGEIKEDGSISEYAKKAFGTISKLKLL